MINYYSILEIHMLMPWKQTNKQTKLKVLGSSRAWNFNKVCRKMTFDQDLKKVRELDMYISGWRMSSDEKKELMRKTKGVSLANVLKASVARVNQLMSNRRKRRWSHISNVKHCVALCGLYEDLVLYSEWIKTIGESGEEKLHVLTYVQKNYSGSCIVNTKFDFTLLMT